MLRKNLTKIILTLFSIIFAVCAAATVPAEASEISAPTKPAIISHSENQDTQHAQDTYILSDGTQVDFIYTFNTGMVKIYRNKVLQKSISDKEILRKANRKFSPLVYKPNGLSKCSATMAGVGIVNSILWGAAGLTAAIPPAAVAATVGGVVTGAVIAIGGAFC